MTTKLKIRNRFAGYHFRSTVSEVLKKFPAITLICFLLTHSRVWVVRNYTLTAQTARTKIPT